MSERGLLLGGRDGKVRLHDRCTGAHVTTPADKHSGSVTALACNDDASFALSGSEDCTVRLWDPCDIRREGG